MDSAAGSGGTAGRALAGKGDKAARAAGVTTARDLVRRWRLAGVGESGTLLVQRRPWCWLTSRGQALIDLNVRNWEPTTKGLRTLAHCFHVNQVRLWLEQAYPQAEWKSERMLRQGVLSRVVTA